jgi:hypothetical protein
MSKDLMVWELPEFAANPDKIPTDVLDECYQWNGTGWQMTDDAKAYVKVCKAECDELIREHEEAMASANAEHVKIVADLTERKINAEVRTALEAAGVKDHRMQRAAAALLRSELQIDGDGNANVGGNVLPLPAAVESWLASESGAPFITPKPKAPDNYWQSRIKGLS